MRGWLNAAVCPRQLSKANGFSIQLVVNISEIKLGFIVCCSVVQRKMEQQEGGWGVGDGALLVQRLPQKSI